MSLAPTLTTPTPTRTPSPTLTPTPTPTPTLARRPSSAPCARATRPSSAASNRCASVGAAAMARACSVATGSRGWRRKPRVYRKLTASDLGRFQMTGVFINYTITIKPYALAGTVRYISPSHLCVCRVNYHAALRWGLYSFSTSLKLFVWVLCPTSPKKRERRVGCRREKRSAKNTKKKKMEGDIVVTHI